MENKTDGLYKKLLEDLENDPNVIGFFLTGSRGKGLITEHSDYDGTIIVKGEALEEYKNKYKKWEDIDLRVMTVKELELDAEWGSPSAWDRYNYVGLEAVIDKVDKIQKIIDSKAGIPIDKQHDFIAGSLDNYINKVYRFVKNLRDGRIEAAHLESAESIPPLLDAVFALEGRIKPYYKYLDWELTNKPLTKFSWSKDELTSMLIKILKTADLETQQEVLKIVEQIFRQEGFGKVFDGWHGKDKWMMEIELSAKGGQVKLESL